MLTNYAGRRCARALNARRHRRDVDRPSGPPRRASGLKQGDRVERPNRSMSQVSNKPFRSLRSCDRFEHNGVSGRAI